jgi:hypothetical protein
MPINDLISVTDLGALRFCIIECYQDQALYHYSLLRDPKNLPFE